MRVNPRHINLSEKDLEEYIYANPQLVTMPFSESPVDEWIGRQFHVPSGIIDLLGVTGNKCLVVVELKNTQFASNHITQVCRYAKDIEEIAHYSNIANETPYKLLIGTYEPSSEIITEAKAVDTYIKTIDVEYSMKIGGIWRFSQEHEEERFEKLIEISKMNEFVSLASQNDAEESEVESDTAAND